MWGLGFRGLALGFKGLEGLGTQGLKKLYRRAHAQSFLQSSLRV